MLGTTLAESIDDASLPVFRAFSVIFGHFAATPAHAAWGRSGSAHRRGGWRGGSETTCGSAHHRRASRTRRGNCRRQRVFNLACQTIQVGHLRRGQRLRHLVVANHHQHDEHHHAQRYDAYPYRIHTLLHMFASEPYCTQRPFES